MLSFTNELTDDPSWAQLITKEAFVQRWKRRGLAQYKRITQQMLDWCVQEVQDQATQFHHTRLSIALRSSLRRLERVSGYDKSNGPEASQNPIIDPCLYPLRFGLTRYRSSAISLKDCVRLSGKGISRSLLATQINGTLNDTWSYKITNAFSVRYQWLPCDFSFEEETGKTRCENTTDASLSFRHRCSSDDLKSLNSLTRTTKATEDVYGVEDLQPAVQEQGSVTIREGRVVGFPNVGDLLVAPTGQAHRNKVFQTKINPIKLGHPGKKTGHLKLVFVHLIDPNRRIISTSMVPCQRRDWWAREIRQKVPVLRRLPVEISNAIIDDVGDFPVSAIKAAEMRDEMLQERAEL
ncbi:MAG: hypothetical protein Q9207_002449 [Kuettlingeria erythrocarpa]